MPTKYAYEYGKRWNVKTPRNDIRYVVGNMHVSTSDSDITAEVEKRLAKAGPEFTAAIRRECIEYALRYHTANRDLYHHVMRGT